MSDYWGDEEQPVCPILERSMVFHSVNSAPSANGGLNPAWVWYIDRSRIRKKKQARTKSVF